ncbi:MAG: Molybdate transporter substrate-binding protein [Candidatus Acidoferrum typicum]|nr:Molybdate transporter substrate-binding protein [Candidatus Acidoferrum typicum]
MRFPLRCLILLSALLVFRPTCAAQEIRVAAAADLKFALDELGTHYEKQTGRKMDVSYGSSGNFLAQIQNGAPFDVFLSADIEYPRKLEAAGLAEPGTLYEYALGRIVIWMPADTRIDLAQLGWKALLDPSIQKIAIGNPEHAPYGRAAVAALRSVGIYEQVRAKLVYGENIAQAAQFVASGNAQAGILALSLAISPPMREGKRWEIPAKMHPPIEQAAVILKSAKDKDSARAFLTFLKSGEARKILESYGFSVPASAQTQ